MIGDRYAVLQPKMAKSNNTEVEVKIYSLATTANECIVFLEEIIGNRLLPIWIGLAEGQAIAIRFAGVVLPRPLTHDLLLSTFKSLGWVVHRIVVNDLKGNTFYAKIHLHKNSQECVLDSRPSDAIAVAVRAGCPMYIEEKVFQRCQVFTKPITADEVKKFKDELKSIRPEDIFKDIVEKKPKKPEEKKKEEGGEDDKDEGKKQ